MHISCHDKWKAKCHQLEHRNLSVCFVLVQIEMDFPLTDQDCLKSPIFPSDRTFENNLHAMAALRNWLPVYTHAQHTFQNQPWLNVEVET
jgi:hypothetical protein